MQDQHFEKLCSLYTQPSIYNPFVPDKYCHIKSVGYSGGWNTEHSNSDPFVNWTFWSSVFEWFSIGKARTIAMTIQKMATILFSFQIFSTNCWVVIAPILNSHAVWFWNAIRNLSHSSLEPCLTIQIPNVFCIGASTTVHWKIQKTLYLGAFH